MSRAIVLAFAWMLAIPAATWGQSPAEARIRAARERIADSASAAPRAAGLVALATVETARARETGEPACYQRALQIARQEDARRPDPATLARLARARATDRASETSTRSR